jgi:4'-phosphopantetheinyl transferase
LLLAVSAQRQERFSRFWHREDAVASLLGAALMRSCLCEHTSLTNHELQFAVGPFGKPFLSGSDLHFNLSHKGNQIICALSPLPVGIDIEILRSAPEGVAERFFCDEEKQALREAPVAAQNALFYKIWTRKESYIKMLGKGLSEPLAGFSSLRDAPGRFFSDIPQTSAVCSLCQPELVAWQLREITLADVLSRLQH